jgi:C_GCAxxG_C_C family probable redox protein
MDDLSLRILRLKTEGYCCSQIMLVFALEAQGKTNTDLVRAAGGLCFGVGLSGETCGAFSGGACILSLYAGKGSSEETPDYRYALMVNELMSWLKERAKETYGGLRCEDILARHPDKRMCGQIVTETYGMAMEILRAHGLDPCRGRDD